MGHIAMHCACFLLQTLQSVVNIIIIIALCLVELQGLPEYIWLQPYHHHLQDHHLYMLFSKPAGPA